MKPRKPSTTSPKAKVAQLEKEWLATLERHSRPLERGAKAMGIKRATTSIVTVKRDEPRERIPSNPNGMMGLATKAAPKAYTGTAIIGIATMHKSNLVPIFNNEEAVNVATMRRG